MLHYQIFPVTSFQQNCLLLWCDQTMQAAVIDPGGGEASIVQAAQKLGVQIQQILLTHGHVDHCAAAASLARQLDVPIMGPHQADQFWIDALPEIAAQYGFPPAERFTPAQWLHEGDTVQIGQETLHVHHCPGHSPGHVVFYAPSRRHAFVGDVLFAGAIGRTDLPQGDYQQLIQSITQKLWPLGDDVTFTPGHGHESQLGQERATNPFVKDL